MIVNNRYRVEKVIGEGSFGKVYLVRDIFGNGGECALKTLSSSRVSGYSYSDFVREFERLSKLNHPNLTRVFDFGRISADIAKFKTGDYFFTMEYVNGIDLFLAAESYEYERVYQILAQLCSVLEFIHSKGLIHRDIKPENILVIGSLSEKSTDVPVVKLMDLGLATVRSSEFHERAIRGTPEYIAPEVILGDSYDHRIDLYSLGATLYHALSRTSPFKAEKGVDLLKKHLSYTPRPLTEIIEDFPVELDRIVRKLLDKDKDKRYSSASSIFMDIPDGAFHGYSKGDLYNIESYIRSGEFIHEERQFSRLMSAVDSLMDIVAKGDTGIPNAYSIVGEKGAGKTRLMHELNRYCQMKGIPFLQISCSSMASVAYASFVHILRHLLAEAENLGKPGEKIILRYKNQLGILIPELTASSPACLSGREAILSFHDSISRFIFELSRVKSFVIYFDDLHDDDPSSLELLGYILRNLRGNPLIICEAHDPSFENHRFFERLKFSDTCMERIELGQLSEGSVIQMVRSILGDNSSVREFSKLLYGFVGGNPLFIEEAIRSLYFSGKLVKMGGQWRFSKFVLEFGKISGEMERLYRRKLENLSFSAQKLLKILSCMNEPMSSDILPEVESGFEISFKTAVHTLMREELLDVVDGSYRIHQKRVKQLVQESISEDERVEIHNRLSKILEHTFNLNRYFNFEEIGRHFQISGDYVSAVKFFIKAAERAERVFDYERASKIYERIVELAEDKDIEIDLQILESLAGVYSKSGEYKKSISIYKKLLKIAHSASGEEESVRYLRETGILYGRKGKRGAARQMFKNLLSYAASEEEKINLYRELSSVLIYSGGYGEARKYCEKALHLCEIHSKEADLADILNNMAIIDFYNGDLDAAMKLFRETLERRKLIGDRIKIASIYNNMGIVHSARGDFSPALNFWKKSLSLSQEVNNIHQIAVTENNMGIACYNLGNYREALKRYQRSLQIFRKLGDLPGIAMCLNNVGEVNLEICQYERALTSWNESLKFYREIGDFQGLTEVSIHLGFLYQLLNRYEISGEFARKARGYLEKSDTEIDLGNLIFLESVILRKDNKIEESLKKINMAMDFFKEKGDRKRYLDCLLFRGQLHRSAGNYNLSLRDFLEVRQVAAGSSFTHIEYEGIFQEALLIKEAEGKFEGNFGGESEDYLERPITLLKDLAEKITSDRLSETAWRIFFHLAGEYERRGNYVRARENYIKAFSILKEIVKEFESEDLADQYMKSKSRMMVLEKVRGFIR